MAKQDKKALIVGSSGQDGTILFDLLVNLGYSIIGIDKQEIKTHGLEWSQSVDINDKDQVFALIKKIKPDEIYYLAAFHHSSQDKKIDFAEDFRRSYETNVLALINFLEGIRLFSPRTRIFYASSSLIFGRCKKKKQNEQTPHHPENAYSLTKMDGVILCRFYREKYNIFAASGILYNHESEYRTDNFISMKIIKAALRIKAGQQQELIVGDLNTSVDWGYAPDYVQAMNLILNIKQADDFIVATGQTHTVLDFIKVSFGYLGLDWQKFVREDKGIIKENRTVLMGDAKKLRNQTGWKPSVDFTEMIKKIIDKLN